VALDLRGGEETGRLNLIQLCLEKVTFLRVGFHFCRSVMQLDYRIIAEDKENYLSSISHCLVQVISSFLHSSFFFLCLGLKKGSANHLHHQSLLDFKRSRLNQGSAPCYINREGEMHPQGIYHLPPSLSCTCLRGVTSPLNQPYA